MRIVNEWVLSNGFVVSPALLLPNGLALPLDWIMECVALWLLFFSVVFIPRLLLPKYPVIKLSELKAVDPDLYNRTGNFLLNWYILSILVSLIALSVFFWSLYQAGLLSGKDLPTQEGVLFFIWSARLLSMGVVAPAIAIPMLTDAVFALRSKIIHVATKRELDRFIYDADDGLRWFSYLNIGAAFVLLLVDYFLYVFLSR